jgi:hypothetical protein
MNILTHGNPLVAEWIYESYFQASGPDVDVDVVTTTGDSFSSTTPSYGAGSRPKDKDQKRRICCREREQIERRNWDLHRREGGMRQALGDRDEHQSENAAGLAVFEANNITTMFGLPQYLAYRVVCLGLGMSLTGMDRCPNACGGGSFVVPRHYKFHTPLVRSLSFSRMPGTLGQL